MNLSLGDISYRPKIQCIFYVSVGGSRQPKIRKIQSLPCPRFAYYSKKMGRAGRKRGGGRQGNKQ